MSDVSESHSTILASKIVFMTFDTHIIISETAGNGNRVKAAHLRPR